MTYQTSLDKTTKVITGSITVLFAVIIAGQYSVIQPGELGASMITSLLLLFIYIFAFAYHPVNYEVSADELIIHRPASDVKIKMADITSVSFVNRKMIKGCVRTYGVGGLFGYYGSFASLDLGSMTWYATRRNKMVLIQTSDHQKLILTPDEPEKFVAEFHSKAMVLSDNRFDYH